MFETPALIAAAAALTPLMLIACFIDLKYLRIPNWLVLAVLAVFVVTGLWGLPFETFLWRLLYAVIFLVLGFVAYNLAGGSIGAGDIKLIAVLVPFMAPVDLPRILLIWSITAVLGIMLHRVIYNKSGIKGTGWEAFDQKIYFPVGLLIGLTMCLYMGWVLADRFGWLEPSA